MLLLVAALGLAPLVAPALAFQEGGIEVSARLLDPQGNELARERVYCSLAARSPSGREVREDYEKTDRHGRFAWSVEPVDAASLADAPVELDLWVERRDGSALRATRRLPGPVEGKVDLGDTRLEPAPVMVFGRVLDPAGQPVANGTVEFSAIAEWSAQDGRPAGAERVSAHVELKTDAEGRFQLRGIDRGLGPRSRGEVRASSPIYPRTRWVPFGGAGEEVLLQLSAPSSLKGRVVVPEGVDPRSLRVEAFYQGELAPGEPSQAIKPSSDGSFAFRLAAQPCTLALWIDPDAMSMEIGNGPDLVREGVVPGGEELSWDLRDALHVYELAVLTPDGRPAPSPTLFYSSGGRPLWRPYSGLYGRPLHRIVSLDQPLAVRAEEEGFRTATAALDGPRGEIRLSPGIAVGIALANQPDLGAAGWLSIDASTEDGVNPRARADLDPRGSGQLVLPEPGSYSVQLQYQRRVGPAIWSGATSLGFDLGTLEVADREQQTFALTLPPGLVDVFLREAGQRR